jgi:hypothetical protein
MRWRSLKGQETRFRVGHDGVLDRAGDAAPDRKRSPLDKC